MSVRSWIEAQIAKSALAAASAESVARGDSTAATRLVDAAATLRGARGGQVFGLELPAEGVEGADALAEACLREVRAWASVLDDGAKADIGALLVRRGLPPLIAAAQTRERVGTLEVMLDVTVEEDDVEISDAARLRALDGVESTSGALLADVPCVAAVTGGAKGWVLETGVRLAYGATREQLFCELSFEAARTPSEDEIAALTRVIERDLLDTSWGLNLEWEHPDDVARTILLKARVALHRFEEAS